MRISISFPTAWKMKELKCSIYLESKATEHKNGKNSKPYKFYLKPYNFFLIKHYKSIGNVLKLYGFRSIKKHLYGSNLICTFLLNAYR